MSPEKDQDYFCEGLAEELINALVSVEDLSVASRTSAFRFKGTQQDIREIGRRLGVSTVLEGSVRKAGSQVRISTQLVNVDDGYHLWSERFDRKLEDVFAIQDEIAQKIVEALQVTLTPQAKQKAEQAAPADVQAYDYYLKGRKFFYEFRAKGFELARQMFARATVVDETYARAYAGVADCCSFIYMYYDSSSANLKEADAASRKAVEMDPDNAEAHASRGLALNLSGRNEEANAEFAKAIELNPKLYEAHYFYGRALFAQGEAEEAASKFEEACRVNPEDYQAPFFLAQTYLSLGKRAYAAANLRKAVEAAKKHLAFHTDDVRALYLGAGGLVELGELELAQEWVARAREIDPKRHPGALQHRLRLRPAGRERRRDGLPRDGDRQRSPAPRVARARPLLRPGAHHRALPGALPPGSREGARLGRRRHLRDRPETADSMSLDRIDAGLPDPAVGRRQRPEHVYTPRRGTHPPNDSSPRSVPVPHRAAGPGREGTGRRAPGCRRRGTLFRDTARAPCRPAGRPRAPTDAR